MSSLSIADLLHRKCNKRSRFFMSQQTEDQAACLSQCLRGDGQNADESISMPAGKPHTQRLCPLAVGVGGISTQGQWVRSGSGVNTACLDLQAEPSVRL